MKDYLLSLISAHVELTSAVIVAKMEADPNASHLLARYHTVRARSEAIRKALDYLSRTGKAIRRSDDGINYWSALRPAAETTEDTQEMASDLAELTEPPAPEYDPESVAFPAGAADAYIAQVEFENALAHPIKIQPDPQQAHRWAAVCQALAASPLLHDTLAAELDLMADHFATLLETA